MHSLIFFNIITLTLFYILYYHDKEYNNKCLPITSARKPIGKTILAKLMTECVLLVGYDNPDRFTLRGLRSYGITQLASATGVAEKDKLAASRHKNMASHALYQRSNDTSRDARYRAFGASEKKTPDSNTKSTSQVPSFVSIDPSKNCIESTSSSGSSNVMQMQVLGGQVNNGFQLGFSQAAMPYPMMQPTPHLPFYPQMQQPPAFFYAQPQFHAMAATPFPVSSDLARRNMFFVPNVSANVDNNTSKDNAGLTEDE